MKSTHKAAMHVVAGVLAMGAVNVANAAIASTKHNLGSTSSAGNNQTNVTAEICVFCHTPHASNTNVKAPLWNKSLPGSTYTVYTSSTLDATSNAGPGGISLACLSCHDGAQAMDTVINAPGSGGYNSAGATMGAAGNWSGTRQTAGKLNATTVALLGTDLTNDHPIGIPYCGNAQQGGSMANCTDGDFFTFSNNATGSGGYVNRSGSTAGKDKTDMYLYANAAGTMLMVECASCHDPHSGNVTFLRTANTGSAVCLTCHNK